MKSIIPLALLVSLSQVILINSSEQEKAYVQTSSSVTQTPNLTESSYILSDPGSAIPLLNFDVSINNESIICKIPGIYLVCDGLQVAVLNNEASGYLDSWFVKNGVPVPNSNSRQYINQDSKLAIVTNTFLIELKKGDVFGVKFIASGPDIGVACIKDLPNGEPDILSFGLTLVKID